MTRLPDDIRTLFEGPNYGHIATTMPDGGPHSVPVWVAMEGDRIAFFTQEGSRKARNIEADPRVAISIVDHDQPYRYATVRGRVVETVEGDAALAIMDRMAVRHTGRPFPYRQGIALLVEPERVHAMKLGFEHAPTV